MKRLIFLVLISFGLLLSGCLNKTSPSSQILSSPNDIKVMSFNVQHGTRGSGWEKYRKDGVIQIIRSHSPDIICMQEPYAFQLKEMSSAMPEYKYYGVGRYDGKDRGEFCPVLFKIDRFRLLDSGTFWFSKTSEKPGSMTWIDLVPRMCSWVKLEDMCVNKQLYVYSLHLTPISNNSRTNNIILLKDRLDLPCIIGGDFNMAFKSSAFDPLREFESTKFEGWQIDHIFTSIDLEIKGYYLDVKEKYPSDHYALIAIINYR